MPTTNENFFTRERMQAIGLGIARGFKAHDRDNPLASAGAAMEATIGTQMDFDQRGEARQQRLDDLAAIEEKQIRAEERSLENAKKMGDIDTEAMIERQRKQRAEDKAWRESQAVVGISRGLRTNRADSVEEAARRQFTQDFMRFVGGNIPRFPGSPPIDPYESAPEYEARGLRRGDDYSIPQDKPTKRSRGMMRTLDGRMVKAIEDPDQDTPIFGDGGRDYAY